MVTSIGLKLFNLSFFHLIFHAYFKALLFLTIGSILHTILDIQDIRFTGSLINFLPISYIFLLVGFISLMALPFTTGYYSKESIIMMSFNFYGFISQYIFIVTLLTGFITVLYSIKFINNIFFNITRLSIFLLNHLHFFSLHLILALFILGYLSIFIGYFLFK
jgi:NADH-ubiquinone oxidoreductase chain 5